MKKRKRKKQPNLKIQFIHCLPIRMTNRLRYIRWWTLCPIGEFHFETDDDESAFDLTVNRRWSTARRWLKVQFFIKFPCVACAIGDGAWSYRLWNNYVKLAQSVISHSNGKWLIFGMSIFVTRPSAKTLQSHNGCVAVAEQTTKQMSKQYIMPTNRICNWKNQMAKARQSKKEKLHSYLDVVHLSWLHVR